MSGSAVALTLAPGLLYRPDYLDGPAQATLLRDVRDVIARAPLFTPTMPRTGQPFSVRMTNCGPLGWVSDAAGYRYQPLHPVTGEPWPSFPPALLAAWEALSGYAAPPEACLINVYGPQARMGLHQDRDETALDAPVVSLSLGAEAVFRVGGVRRSDPTRSLRLRSGDAFVIGGSGRLVYHGVDRIVPGTSALVEDGGRINLTLRRVNPAPPASPDTVSPRLERCAS
jgi:DNA oxidative demethylase